MHRLKRSIPVAVSIFILVLCLQKGHGQENPEILSVSRDTIVLPNVIPYNEILIASGESRIRTTRIAESLISPERIEIENQRNDSILVLINQALSQSYQKDYSKESQRFLSNENNYWQTANNHLKTQKERLSDLIMRLQNQQEQLETELQLWENTSQVRDSSYALSNISQVIQSTLDMLNKLIKDIDGRTGLLVSPLLVIILLGY